MMLSMERSYLEGELATGFVRPYEGYEYGFVGLLPNEGVTVSELLASLDGGRGRETIAHHVTRFFPRWRLTDRPSTPVEVVRGLAEMSRRHLDHVYVGNC